MSREGAIHLTCLYGPLVAVGMLASWVRPGKLHATGLLFALAWNAALLPSLDGFARWFGMWTYHSQTAAIGGMPLALYFGWIIAWGLVAPLLSHVPGGRMWTAVALLVAINLRAMPEMRPVLELHPHWWIGKLLIAALLLVPSMLLADWTKTRTRTGLRCAMLAPAFGGIFLGIPLLVECGDLALSGDGTPVPLDPPRRLVTHGVYAYVRNPMQFSMTALLLPVAVFLMSPWPAILALLGVVYSEGLARWSENQDMRGRFGAAWCHYHQSVRPWRPRWHPRIGGRRKTHPSPSFFRYAIGLMPTACLNCRENAD